MSAADELVEVMTKAIARSRLCEDCDGTGTEPVRFTRDLEVLEYGPCGNCQPVAMNVLAAVVARFGEPEIENNEISRHNGTICGDADDPRFMQRIYEPRPLARRLVFPRQPVEEWELGNIGLNPEHCGECPPQSLDVSQWQGEVCLSPVPSRKGNRDE